MRSKSGAAICTARGAELALLLGHRQHRTGDRRDDAPEPLPGCCAVDLGGPRRAAVDLNQLGGQPRHTPRLLPTKSGESGAS